MNSSQVNDLFQESQQIEIVVPAQKVPERIDKFLIREIANISRTRLQQLIGLELVLVDGKVIKPSHTVLTGEKIAVTLPRLQKTEVAPQNIPLNILYEDEFLLVVNKPAGMVVHPAIGNPDRTLVNALLFHCTDLSGINGEIRPGIVHRLDKDTSGLLVAAKNDVTHRKLSAQFSDRTVSRNYIALVWGHLSPKTATIETFYGRSSRNRKKMSVLNEGKWAVTSYAVLEELPLLSLIRLKLGTGRTHQIRVHMAHIGHPVFSDYAYGGRNRRLGSLNVKDRELAARYLEMLQRQALHAQTLEFVHPATGEKMNFTSPVPDDIQSLLEFARSRG